MRARCSCFAKDCVVQLLQRQVRLCQSSLSMQQALETRLVVMRVMTLKRDA